MKIYDTLKKFNAVLSVSGSEQEMAKTITEIISPFVDEIHADAMGNLIALKKSTRENAEKLMLSAHMDHIGFMVMDIDSDGRARVAPIGGISAIAASYSVVSFASGLKGVLVPESGTAAADIKAEKLYVDFGTPGKKAIEKKVRIGDVCAVCLPLTRLSGGCVSGSFMDNKISCACLIETARELASGKELSLPYDVYFVFTAQEEVGCRGAKTAAYSIAPDYGINVDIYPAADVIGGKSGLKLGAGPSIKIKDASVLCTFPMIKHLKASAEEADIKYQIEVATFGGTDTSSVITSHGGVMAGAISIPTRHTHSQVEMLKLSDAENAVELLTASVKKSFINAATE
ncbi:putative aminopeptidase YsdC [bioreactor metagenome]|uniref:Putative aminopeptidase YsdC n=1 Tax=bioreactor metagenome TaxID=1076179 RepID=A0A645A778_9ZZZZ|nr:M20/M25/M40 family metallo-hydrolase [Oscillospiraceae bacterium]